jgi:hypothetical protein
MKIDLEDLRKRYAGMSDEQLESLSRADLTDAARECYDQELARRSSLQPTNDAIVAGTTSPFPGTDDRSGLPFSVAVLVAFGLFVGVGFFWFEDVAKWLGILCYLAGGALALKVASDQGRNAGLWAVLALMLGPIASLFVLALPPGARALQQGLTQTQRSLIALLPLVLCPVVVYALLAATGQGSFRIVNAFEVSSGYDPQFAKGENLCGKIVNLEGEVVATGIRVADQSSAFYKDDPGFAISDGSQEASIKDYEKKRVLSPEDRMRLTSVQIVGSKRYPLPQVKDRLRVGLAVQCTSWAGPGYRYRLLETSRQPAP